MLEYIVMLVGQMPINGHTRPVLFMAVKNGQPFWVDKASANRYSSKYAAKRHLKTLDYVPDNVSIVRVESDVDGDARKSL